MSAALSASRCYPKSLPIRTRRGPSVSLEELPEVCDILISDRVTDLLHRAMVTFEQAFGGGDSQFLQVDQGAVSRSLFEAPNKVA